MTDREQLERLYAEWGRGDLTRDDIFDPEIESTNYGVGAEAKVVEFAGLAELGRGMAEWLGAFQMPLILEAEEIMERGDRFLVLLRWRGQGRGSGAPVDAEGAHLWEFRDGLAVRFDVYRDRDHAMRDFQAGPGTSG